MIEFNLLPDVKLAYVKTRRLKRLITLGSLLLAAVTFAIFVLLVLFVDVFQHTTLHDLDRDISSKGQTLQNTPNLNKVLTVQNQLQSLPALYKGRPLASRLFTYMTQVTPAQATISNLNIDFVQNTLSITGDADSLATVNQYVDTLKFTTYTTDQSNHPTNAFSSVVLSNFGTTNKSTSYVITLLFDKTIFDQSRTVALTVPPNKTTTRSVTQDPTDLFKQQTSPSP